jgi:primosomal protein N' (replication factor Y)
MEFFDVIFPLNLGPLTYKSELPLKPGMLVRAEIKKSIKTGIVFRLSSEPHSGKTKGIESVIGDKPVLGAPMLKLITWMSDYYFSKEGSVLKGIFPAELFKEVRQKKKGMKIPSKGISLEETEASLFKDLKEHITNKKYAAFLLKCQNTSCGISSVMNLISGGKNIIVLAPQISLIRHISGIMEGLFGERFVALHSGLSGGARSDALKRIMRGESDIVLGSRYAAFAPLGDVSLIVVMHEESPLYKEEGGIRYNARDMAVMRGFLEGRPVLLTSICPSLESYHNVKKGKYRLIEPGIKPRRPKVKVIDMRYAERKTPYLSRPLADSALRKIKEGGRVMFLINRKGYSMLGCSDCGHIEKCGLCGIPLVFYKAEKSLRCRLCGHREDAPAFCPGCRGTKITLLGAGIERVEEDIKKLTETAPLTLERKRKPKLSLINLEGVNESSVVIGTKLIAREEAFSGFLMASVINGDSCLYIPDFRSSEKMFQELFYLSEKAEELIIQTSFPSSHIFRRIKGFDYEGFFGDELEQRSALNYPPLSRIVVVHMSALPGGVERLLNKASKSVEALGPAPLIEKGGKKQWRVLFKSSSRDELQRAVKLFLEGLKAEKINAYVDVDPVSI